MGILAGVTPSAVDDTPSASSESGSADEVIFALRSSGPASRAELAARLGLSRSHIGRIVGDLARAGLVVDFVASPRERRPVGRPGQLMALRAGLGYAVGVNITSTEVRCLVTDLSHRWVTSSSDPLDSPIDLADALDTVVACIARITERVGADHGQCLGVGIALPVPIDERTHRASRTGPTDLWGDAPVAEQLQRRLGVDVHVGNHGNLAVGAELLWGVGREVADFIWLGLDTTVGGGICSGGRLLRGADGYAGELGHLIVDPDGQICRCGGQGCLETVASLGSLQRALEPVHGLVDLSTIHRLVTAEDPAAVRAVTNAATAAGIALAGLTNILNPSTILIGGTLGRPFGRVVTATVAAEIRRRALPAVRERVRVEFSRLIRPEPLGAAALVLTDPRHRLRLGNDRRPYWVVDETTGSGSAIGPSRSGSSVS